MTSILAIVGMVLASSAPLPSDVQAHPITLGIDVLLSPQSNSHLALLAQKRVGLLTHAAAVDGGLNPTADRLAADPRVNLVQLYAPEHGIRGVLKAGEAVADGRDPVTQLPVQALWGKRRRPTQASLAGIDVLVVDLQTLGSRTYTFESSLAESMIAAAQADIPVVVLDRPNPLGGWGVEGPVVPASKRPGARRSMVGWGPIPVVHGLTIGELARYYNAELELGCTLHVVPMAHWRRHMTWEDTGLHWVPTSPGIPHVVNAHLYVATGMIGGVTININEGVGTTMPFETIAASFIDPIALRDALGALSLPGIKFRALSYRPYYHRHRRQILGGVQLIVTDPGRFQPLQTALTMMTTIEALYPGKIKWRKASYVRRIWAGSDIAQGITDGNSSSAIAESWRQQLIKFKRRRASFLLYP